MKPKKIVKLLTTALLTAGASTILGFLSFSGMLALSPLLPLAFSAFALSVVYEGEIYWQNITGALDKLFFKRNYLQEFFANRLLRKHFPNTDEVDCPQFFKDYESQLKLLDRFNHQRLDEASIKRKKQLEKRIRAMERWFAEQLFRKDKKKVLSDYEQHMADWMNTDNRREEWQGQFNTRRLTLYAVATFSVVAAGFMALGTTYLLVEAFASLTILATLPFGTLPIIIAPMAVIAGISYGFLTYNAITDMINNKTIQKFFNHFYKDYILSIANEWNSPNRSNTKLGREIFKTLINSLLTLALISVAVGLTICTAGTWWTITKETAPLLAKIYPWAGKIPGFVMGIINPIITSTSTIFFNLENMFETLSQLRGFLTGLFSKKEDHDHHHDHHEKEETSFFKRFLPNENLAQRLNPFRIFLKLTYMPLRYIGFAGHLISIGVTSDRVPGIPQIASALLGIFSEGFEDYHYFFADLGHDHSHEHKAQIEESTAHQPIMLEEEDHEPVDHVHETFVELDNPEQKSAKQETKILLNDRFKQEHGHDHSSDIPTKVLRFIFWPLFMASAGYDYWFSKNHKNSAKALSWEQAKDKAYGLKPETTEHFQAEDPLELKAWEKQHSVYLIDKYIDKNLKSSLPKTQLTCEKIEGLKELKETIRLDNNPETSAKTIIDCNENSKFNTHRFFGKGPTRTARFLDKLPETVQITLPTAPIA